MSLEQKFDESSISGEMIIGKRELYFKENELHRSRKFYKLGSLESGIGKLQRRQGERFSAISPFSQII